MPARSSDQVIQHAREVRAKSIQDCSRRTAQKIVARIKAGKVATDALTKLVA